MGSSRRRRGLRHFFQSALQSAGRHWWRGPVPHGNGRPRKAVYTAERSGGSKPRRKRGLRLSRVRSRERHPRASPEDFERQSPPREVTSRVITKAVSQLEFWQRRKARLVEQMKPHVEKNYNIEGQVLDTRRGVSRPFFDFDLYRFHKSSYAKLRAHARKVKAVAPNFGSWPVFLDDYFRWAPPGAASADRVLHGSEFWPGSFLSALSHLPGSETNRAPPPPPPRVYCRSCGGRPCGNGTYDECVEFRRRERRHAQVVARSLRPPRRRR